MEHRILLTNQEAFEVQKDLKILSVEFLKDEYTGTKDYETPVSGVIYKFTSACEYKGIKGVWLEYKWTAKTSRFEIEFEEKVPMKFASRPNIAGWNILTSQ